MPLSHSTARLSHKTFYSHLLKEFEPFTNLHLCILVNTELNAPTPELFLIHSLPLLPVPVLQHISLKDSPRSHWRLTNNGSPSRSPVGATLLIFTAVVNIEILQLHTHLSPTIIYFKIRFHKLALKNSSKTVGEILRGGNSHRSWKNICQSCWRPLLRDKPCLEAVPSCLALLPEHGRGRPSYING